MQHPHPRHRPAAAGPRRRAGRRGAAALGLCLAPALGECLTWDYVPTISTGIRYETNAFYVSDSSDEDDAYAGVLDVKLAIRGESDRARISVEPRGRFSAYTGSDDDSALNSGDYYLPIAGTWLSELRQYGVNAGYSQISTRDSEVRVTDPNQPGQPGSSGRVVTIDEDQERWYVQPSLSIQVTPRDIFGASLQFEDVNYTEADLTNRSNYEYLAASTSWTRSLGIKSRVNASVNADGFRADQPGSTVENETFSYGFDVGYEYALSDVTTLGVTVGTSRSDIKVTGLPTIDDDQDPTTPPIACFDPQLQALVLCELRTDDENFVGQVFFRQRSARTITTELRASRSLQPNSDGAQVTQDVFSGYVAKEFTQRLSGSLGATYMRQEAVGKNTGGTLSQRFDRDYTQANATLTWRLARSWWLDCGYYYYSDEQTSGVSYTVTNHAVNVYLRYSGLGSH